MRTHKEYLAHTREILTDSSSRTKTTVYRRACNALLNGMSNEELEKAFNIKVIDPQTQELSEQEEAYLYGLDYGAADHLALVKVEIKIP